MVLYACKLWSKYTQTSMKCLHAAYNNAYRIMHYILRNVFAHTRLTIESGPLMPCWETICIDFLYAAHLHPTFLIDHFKCLILFTNLHFSSIIQSCCVMETKYSSCWWIVLVFTSHQYYFCVAKNVWAMCTHKAYKKQEMLLKCFVPLNAGHVQTSTLQCTTLWLTIFWSNCFMSTVSTPNQCCHFGMKKTPRIYLEKTPENNKKPQTYNQTWKACYWYLHIKR